MNGLPFSVTFSAVAVAAAQDLFELVAPSNSKIELIEIDIGQYSDAGDAQDELLSIQIIRGFTTTGSGGTGATPGKLRPWSRAAAATAFVNNTTLAANGTGVIVHATSFNVRAGWLHRPVEGNTDADSERIFLSASERAVVRITAPIDAVTMNGTLKFREIGS